MSFRPCPGSGSFTQPKPDVVACPGCGSDVEIWSDEATGQCATCSRVVIRTETQSCVDWCRFARNCLGDQKFKEYGQMKVAMRKATLLQAVAERLGPESPEIAVSHATLRYAEMICSETASADPTLVVAAAIMVGIVTGADAGAGGEPWREGLSAMLHPLGYAASFIADAGDILAAIQSGSASGKLAERVEYAIVHDAAALATQERCLGGPEALAPMALAEKCRTASGRKIAMELRHMRPRV